MSNFHVGQQVVCIDDSPAANPWHRAYPLVKRRVYTVHSLTNGIGCIDIDGSGRAWENWRFRPVHTTDISIFTAMLAPVPRKMQRVN